MAVIKTLDFIISDIKPNKEYIAILPKKDKNYTYHYYLIAIYNDEAEELRLFEYKNTYSEDVPAVRLNVYPFRHAEVFILYAGLNYFNWNFFDCVKGVIRDYYLGDLESKYKGIEECKTKYISPSH